MMQQIHKHKPSSIEDDLVCSITLELPIDPVTAEDGFVYDRDAIEEYFHGKSIVRSPLLNTRMGKKLLPAPKIRNHIAWLVDQQLIPGDLATQWKTATLAQKKRQSWIQLAQQGDVNAMERVAKNYNKGVNGFPHDRRQAYQWYEKAHQAGSVIGTAAIGSTLAAQPHTTAKGFLYLGQAAERGSDLAAFNLGMAFAHGWFGALVDHEEAIRWLEKVDHGNCQVKHLHPKSIQRARRLLVELKKTSRNNNTSSLDDNPSPRAKEASLQSMSRAEALVIAFRSLST